MPFKLVLIGEQNNLVLEGEVKYDAERSVVKTLTLSPAPRLAVASITPAGMGGKKWIEA